MKKIVIAYHIFLGGLNFKEVIIDQIQRLKDDLLARASKLFIGVTYARSIAHRPTIEWLQDYITYFSKHQGFYDKVEIQIIPENNEMRETLRWIKDYSAANPEDYVLFFHTKGITHNHAPVTAWRRYMEYFNLDRWKDAVIKLDEGYDCAGVMWNRDTPIGYFPHFSGAFFWAKCKYINTLDHSYIDSDWRYHQEFWIGSNPNTKVFELHNSRLNDKQSLLDHKGHYDVVYQEKEYIIRRNKIIK